jgi:hypothetical protein
MQIREGAYYRTRGDGKNPGAVFGPMQFSSGSQCWRVPGWSWTVTGQRYSNHEDEMDLITEVYVIPRGAGRKGMSDIVERLRNTPNWMREEFGSWKSVMRSYDRDGNGRVIGPLMFTGDGEFLHLVAEVYVSDTPPSDDVMLNLSEIARTKSKAMGEGNFGINENPPCGIRLRWLVEVVDRPHDTPPAAKETEAELREMMRDPRYWRAREPEFVKRVTDGFRALVGGDAPPADAPAPEAKTLRDEFAMAALKAMLGHSEYVELSPDQMAVEAYRQASAMMEARKK